MHLKFLQYPQLLVYLILLLQRFVIIKKYSQGVVKEKTKVSLLISKLRLQNNQLQVF